MRRPQWETIESPKCDLCESDARYRHPLGGLRCVRCPKPVVKRFGIFDTARHRWWPREFATAREAQTHRCKGMGSRGVVKEIPEVLT
jgi:hypothetical protein